MKRPHHLVRTDSFELSKLLSSVSERPALLSARCPICPPSHIAGVACFRTMALQRAKSPSAHCLLPHIEPSASFSNLGGHEKAYRAEGPSLEKGHSHRPNGHRLDGRRILVVTNPRRAACRGICGERQTLRRLAATSGVSQERRARDSNPQPR